MKIALLVMLLFSQEAWSTGLKNACKMPAAKKTHTSQGPGPTRNSQTNGDKIVKIIEKPDGSLYQRFKDGTETLYKPAGALNPVVRQ